MTGPVVPSDEELIAALADEYARWTAAPYEPADWQRNNGDDLARANLLPVVRRYADQRAAEELRAAIASVQAVYDLQCPAMPADHYVGAGAHSAHKWWETVLGGRLRDLRDRAAALTAREEAGR